ncbi:hypothetical protein ACTGV7_10280, partial [Streptococcus suis]
QILQQMLDLAGVDLLVLGGEIAEHLSLPVQNKLAMVLRELSRLLPNSLSTIASLFWTGKQSISAYLSRTSWLWC